MGAHHAGPASGVGITRRGHGGGRGRGRSEKKCVPRLRGINQTEDGVRKLRVTPQCQMRSSENRVAEVFSAQIVIGHAMEFELHSVAMITQWEVLSVRVGWADLPAAS